MTVPMDEDVAEKFARTAGYINKVVSYVSDLLRKSKGKLSGCIKQLYEGQKPSITIRIHVSRVPYLSEEFLTVMPDTLNIEICLGIGESLADTDAGSSAITIYVDERYGIDDVLAAVEDRLPHELRHLVDAHDSEMLETMIRTLEANSSGDRDAYASDRGEYNARLSAVLSVALKRLADPRVRSKVHSADDLVENIRWTSQFEELMQDFDDKQYITVRDILVRILQNVMHRMN